ncbi:hypothetical protein [Actinoplanes palleronii]|uniref:DUF8108 domain-containing protein n=1 Tax=Actinoplanes palleronii TaxID=113570 RepID=A0ABQ4BQR0_9ACTN|nr:hypothetical protein [Actinoplanes palleronii]GIE72565.1 hypothetical protein Apa02nite_086730 [Actinoplanes palleronii]
MSHPADQPSFGGYSPHNEYPPAYQQAPGYPAAYPPAQPGQPGYPPVAGQPGYPPAYPAAPGYQTEQYPPQYSAPPAPAYPPGQPYPQNQAYPPGQHYPQGQSYPQGPGYPPAYPPQIVIQNNVHAAAFAGGYSLRKHNSVGLHILLFVLTYGIGNLIYAWYVYDWNQKRGL